ncbi:hypothetical protein DSL72_001818 [Monilinia vaccinii-corymbosi]|uniref:Uncharacterized protein n=1 Tax=Monilinia vaccinii-corymbosi TaxID=61207 RepID=A0A8A3PAX7_9HELO|nr:hypothetical protein DSL72_001818 [Monilinia vaccinii-corymbosi]
MTWQPANHPPESPDRTTNNSPAPPPSPAGRVAQAHTLYHGIQLPNTASEQGFQGRLDDSHWESQVLDMIMGGNSKFPNFREFEIFVYLYKKEYHHMDAEERAKLGKQLLALQDLLPQRTPWFAEAIKSITACHPYFSLEHFANQSENGGFVVDMVDDCINTLSFVLDQAMKEVGTAQTTKESENNWKELDIQRLRAIITRHDTQNQWQELTNAVGEVDEESETDQPPPHCPDPPVYQHVYDTADVPSDLQNPWNYDECLDYLARRMVNFMTSPDPEHFVFSLPSAAKLEGMNADERAECVRQHIIEQDDKYTSGLHGTRMERREHVAKRASHSPSSVLLYTALVNSRENRFRKRIVQGYDYYAGREDPLSWSTRADDGKSDSTWGEGSESGWLPAHSNDWSPSKEKFKHVSFSSSTKDTSELHEQNKDDACIGATIDSGSKSDLQSRDAPVFANKNLGYAYMPHFSRTMDRDNHLQAAGTHHPSWKDSIARAMEVWASDPESGDDGDDDSGANSPVQAPDSPKLNHGRDWRQRLEEQAERRKKQDDRQS